MGPLDFVIRRRRPGRGRISPRTAAVRSFPRALGSGPVESQAFGLSASRVGDPLVSGVVQWPLARESTDSCNLSPIATVGRHDQVTPVS